MLRPLLLRASESEVFRARVSQLPGAGRAVRRFMPGETLGEALEAARSLREEGLPAVLTHLGESVTDASAVAAVEEEYLRALEAIQTEGHDVELSVKPTQFGFDLDRELCREAVGRVLARARAQKVIVWIDMEGSATVDDTLRLYRSLREEGPGVGICLQAYLHRTVADLEELLLLSPAVRLVKGAYREPPGIALQKPMEVNAAFLKLGRRLLKAESVDPDTRAVFGTHDLALIRELNVAARDSGADQGAPECHLLYGIRAGEQRLLAREGHRVRVLISYGEAWYPWYMRRLAERPANLAFALRALLTPSRRAGRDRV